VERWPSRWGKKIQPYLGLSAQASAGAGLLPSSFLHGWGPEGLDTLRLLAGEVGSLMLRGIMAIC